MVFLCGGDAPCGVCGYLPTPPVFLDAGRTNPTYRFVNCWRQVCERFRVGKEFHPFALLQVDDDISLRPHLTLPYDRNLCDRVPTTINWDAREPFFLDNRAMANQRRSVCLSYFMYLSPLSTASMCRSLKYVRYYRPEDLTVSLWLDYIGVKFSDISDWFLTSYWWAWKGKECIHFQQEYQNPFVKCIRCPLPHRCMDSDRSFVSLDLGIDSP